MGVQRNIFIACSYSNRAYLDDLKVHLHARFADVSVFVWDEYAEQTRPDEIAGALSGASGTIVINSAAFGAMPSVSSGQFADHATRALALGRQVMVVDIEPDSPPLPGEPVGLGGWFLGDLTDDAQDRVWVDMVARLSDEKAPTAGPCEPMPVSRAEDEPHVTPLRSPLIDCHLHLASLIEAFADQRGADPLQRLANAVLSAFGATMVVIARDAHAGSLAAHAHDPDSPHDPEALTAMVMEFVGSRLGSRAAVARAGHGVAGELPPIDQSIVVAPISIGNQPDAFVAMIGSFANDVLVEATGVMLAAGFLAARADPQLEPDRLEATILDRLRDSFGRLPRQMYVRRRELFADRLRTMRVHFQPVVHLHPEMPTISSWEALARDPRNGRAPHDLFAAAELWGRRFRLHLDEFMLTHATHEYRRALSDADQKRVHDWRPLAINAYPDSIASDDYLAAVRSVIEMGDGVPGNLLSIELSERLPLPQPRGEIWVDSPAERFVERLKRFIDLEVDIAIDDFGVGDSSVARLGALKPRQVKIDRELIMQPHPDLAIGFVHDLLVRTMLVPPRIVAEGFDDEAPISLGGLYGLGIKYVQGFALGRPSVHISRLDVSVVEQIRTELRRPATA